MEEPTALGPHTAGVHAAEHHLPPPSIWPVLTAIGVSMAITGLAIRPWVWVLGLVICAVTISGWLRELGRDLVEAPREPEA